MSATELRSVAVRVYDGVELGRYEEEEVDVVDVVLVAAIIK
jgi:hypothetical protein